MSQANQVLDQYSSECVVDNQLGVHAALLHAEEFERYEDKYLVPIKYQDELLELLYQKSRPHYLTSDTRFLTIQSSYYESPQFHSFRDHFLAKPYRYKLRTRIYGSNGKFLDDEAAHIELKTKEGETSRKFRFKVDRHDLTRLHQFLPIRMSAALGALNETIPGEELSRRAKNISRLVLENELTPVCNVTYQRQAFERKGVRVTLDTGIESHLLLPVQSAALFEGDVQIREQAQAMVQRFLEKPHALLEVKHRGLVPKWLESFTLARTSGKSSFSKYCYAMTTHLLRKNRNHASSL